MVENQHYKHNKVAATVNIFWFRRDLRLEDNVGFSKALQGKLPVMPIFIFDTEILDKLSKDDARVSFIYNTLQDLKSTLQEHGSSLAIYYGKPLEIFKKLTAQFNVQNVITNRDYEPYGQERDLEIKEYLTTLTQHQDSATPIGFYDYKDQVIFEKDTIVKADGTPYVVYTPYKNKWKSVFNPEIDLKDHKTIIYFKNLHQNTTLQNTTLEQMGFSTSSIKVPKHNTSATLIQNYEDTRNFPAVDGTSHLGPHLRFGTVSVRAMMRKAISQKMRCFGVSLFGVNFLCRYFGIFRTHKKKPLDQSMTALCGVTTSKNLSTGKMEPPGTH